MPTDSWVNETLYAEWGQRFLVKREPARVKSDVQDIMVFESHTPVPYTHSNPPTELHDASVVGGP